MTPTNSWARLPVLALLAFFFSTLRLALRQLNQALPALAIVLVASPTVRNSILAAAAAVLVMLLVVTVLRYLRFQYAIGTEQVQVRQGVLQRSELVLEFERIQQADIQQPFYLRPFRLAILTLQGAGSQANEVELAGIPLARARHLQQLMLARRGRDHEPQDTTIATAAESAPAFSFRLGAGEVLRIGLMHNALLLFGVIGAVVFSNPQVAEQVQATLLAWAADFDSTVQAVWVMGGIGLGLLVVLVLGSVLFYFNQYYGYHLRRQGQRYRYTAGLLNTLSRSMKVYKLQLVVIKQGLIARLLRRRQCVLHQAGGHQQTERFTIPVVSVAREQALRDDLNIPPPQWQRVHPALIPRYLVLPALLGWFIFSYWGLLLALGVMLLARWRWWACYYWSWNEDWLAVRQGLLGQQQRWLPVGKLQSVRVSRSPLQRLFGVASVQVSSAGGPVVFSCLPATTALDLQAALIARVEQERRRWM